MRASYSFYQPIYTIWELPTYWLGYAAAAYNIISSISALLYSNIRNRMNKWHFMFLLILMQIVSTFGIAYINAIFAVGFIMIQQFQRGIMGPFMNIQVNSYINSNCGNRVTLLSVFFSITTVFSSLLLWLSSILTQKNDLYFSLKVFAICVNSATIIIFLLLYYMDKHQKITNYANIENTTGGDRYVS